MADAQPLGVSARMWADGPIEKGHEYQLLCQLRVHTIKGEFGPLLGDAAQPGGTTLLVASGKADEKWSGLEGAVDITRKELGTMTNLPTGKAVVALRVEPQLFDRTTNKYLTASKTKAIIVMIGFDSRGKVDSATSLGAWVAQNAHYQSDQVLEVLGGLDEIAAEGNKLPDAIGAALSIKELPDATKLRYVQATPKEIVHMKNPALWAALSELATNSNNGELKAAAAALLK